MTFNVVLYHIIFLSNLQQKLYNVFVLSICKSIIYEGSLYYKKSKNLSPWYDKHSYHIHSALCLQSLMKVRLFGYMPVKHRDTRRSSLSLHSD